MFGRKKNKWHKTKTKVIGVGILTDGLIRIHEDWVIDDYQFGYLHNVSKTEVPEHFIMRKRVVNSASIWLPLEHEQASINNPIETILKIVTLSKNELDELFVSTKNAWIKFMQPITERRKESQKKENLGFSAEGGESHIGKSASTKELMNIK